MSLKSNPQRYGTVAVSIHWVSALLIIILLGTGLRADQAADAAARITVLRIHIVLGLTILLLTLARLAWWRFADRKPAPVAARPWQNRLSGAVHFLFYVVILGMAASGIGMLVLSGAAPLIFEGAAGVLPDFDRYPPRRAHGFGARLMIALFVLHTGAALYHHIFKRDGLMRRMWFGAR
ncbi:cytochrome b [Hoeflea poritis]|uniref:Cytochrome b/b6 domain-containing protein n=1 Tax=Hoeflea poritis TaxID=2993659 RepID=A0ABT4VLD8_9HYPH|nr:cytochrome b/b6 domain-containing protein [Hoeflea poritis]MDA4845536.1 cytochrome b/b6 domain-containing protein [Hoeflea poritis]